MSIVLLLLDVYAFIIFVTIALSWLGLSPENPVVKFMAAVTEPVLAPIRKVMPDLGGFDLSAMVLLIALQLLRRFLGGLGD